MAMQVTMPKLSDTMEEGTILRWYKQVGESISQGEVIAEVETDKADMELEAEGDGVLQEIRVKEGEAAAVGAVIAVVDAGGGESRAEAKPAAAASSADVPQSKSSTPSKPTAEDQKKPASEQKSAPRPAEPAAESDRGADGKPQASGKSGISAAKPAPVSRSFAGKPAVAGSKAPVPGTAAARPQQQTEAAPPPPPGTKWKPRNAEAPPQVEPGRHEVTKLRQTVAKQMTMSKREIPHFYVISEIDMTEATRVRAELVESNAIPERITYTHLLIRALTLTLQRHPRVNASWVEGAVDVHSDINIGIAVAVEDGLVAPVLHKVQDLGLRQIAHATQGLVEKAQSGKFSGAEMTGATFTISNMGMLDIDEFSAVITPPQAAILAVGSIKERAIVRNGQLAVAKTMRVTLSADHRVLNGVEAGRFLEDLKHALEHPVLLVIDA